LIGPLKQTHTRNNIIWYGEMEYLQTIPYIKHANIALSPIVYASVADSNKIQQYTFFKLPIVTSSLNHSARKNVFYYDIGDDQTVQKSLNEAIAFERATLPITSVRSWEDLVNELLSPE
jgi:2-beta-glucuronyltransferase